MVFSGRAHISARKQRWKWILALFALFIVGATWYFNHIIIRKISDEERNRITLWAEAVKREAELISVTEPIFERIAQEERRKIELWAEANRKLAITTDPHDLNFYLKIIAENNTIPVMAVDENGNVVAHRNIFPENYRPSPLELNHALEQIKSIYPPIEIQIWKGKKQYLYYDDSNILKDLKKMIENQVQRFFIHIVRNAATVPVIVTDSTQLGVIAWGNIDSAIMQDSARLHLHLQKLRQANEPIKLTLGREGKLHYVFYETSPVLRWIQYFPFLQIPVIALFIFVAYLLYNTVREAEKNKLWVGMARETAHQLGTPVSSLMAWVELLRSKYSNDEELKELQQDTERLRIITERFSAIGSDPKMKEFELCLLISHTLEYLKKRISPKVEIRFVSSSALVRFIGNEFLMGWVIENLVKNAVDAMQGRGIVEIILKETDEKVILEVKDNGKGIAPSDMPYLFEPGFTTKEHGWGLGLTLVKRIVEDYHHGRITAHNNTDGKGATFVMEWKKKDVSH